MDPHNSVDDVVLESGYGTDNVKVHEADFTGLMNVDLNKCVFNCFGLG